MNSNELNDICIEAFGVPSEVVETAVNRYVKQVKAARQTIDRKQRESVTTATKSYKRWTQSEDDYILNDPTTAFEKARKLGRSYHAVNSRIAILRNSKS